jgi:hypothetical protein
MHRPRLTAPVLFILAVMVSGCSSSPEQQLISNFFRASRMRDNTTLANISMVSFRPSEEGTVRSFDIESISEESRRPMRAKEFAEALQAAEATEEEFSARKQAYQDENLTVIERVLEAEREGEEPGRRDLEIQEAWTEWRVEMAQHAQTVSDARAALSEERVVVEGSIFSAVSEINIMEHEGEIASKTVRIAAQVTTPDDQTSQQTFIVMVERAELTGPDGAPVTGRWIITSLEPAG